MESTFHNLNKRFEQSTKQKVFKLLERKQIAMREAEKVIKRLIRKIDHQVNETIQKIIKIINKIINRIQVVIKEGKKLGSLVDTDAQWRYKKNKDNFPTLGARKGLTNIDIIRIKTTRFWL